MNGPTKTQAMISAPRPLGEATLPPGCRLIRLTTHADHRGSLTEAFRQAWFDAPPLHQAQILHSKANVLRGIYASTHWTSACLLRGASFVGLHDLRPNAGSERLSALVEITDADRHIVLIAPGVAYGFYFPQPAVLLRNTEAGPNAGLPLVGDWNCAEFGIPWPCEVPCRDETDQNGLDYAAFRAAHLAGVSGS